MMRRTAGILAIVGAVLMFLATVLPYSGQSNDHALHILTALGGQPFRVVAAMAIFHWAPVGIAAAVGAWLLTTRRDPRFAAGLLLGVGIWSIAQAVASLLVPQHRLIGGWIDLLARCIVLASGILAASITRAPAEQPIPPPPTPV
jgi:hypothetical protein